jgi:hypothetical protein
MATNGGPDTITDGLVGQLDAGALNNTDFGGPASSTGYLQAGQLGQTFYVETDVSMSASPYNFEFGGDRYTRIQISGADGDFASTTGPFDLPGFDGYTIEVVLMRTDYGTWATAGGSNYDGIWNYYWNHSLYFSGAHTGQNYIQGTGLSAYTIEMNKYYNVTMTHDNSDGAHKVYIDGNLQQSTTQSNPTLSSGNIRRFYVGNWDNGWSCVGKIPLLRVYNKVLSAGEVTQNFNATKVRFSL